MSNSRPPRATGAVAVLARRRERIVRRLREEDLGAFTVLAALTVVGAVLMYIYPLAFTASVLMLPLLLTVMLLSPRRIPVFVTFVLVVLAAETVLEFPSGIHTRRVVAILIVLVMSAIILVLGWRRNKLGVGGLTGESMLMDLQERITRQGVIPALPHGWYVDAATRASGGTSFAGDFIVAHRTSDGAHLSLAVVDVSGKGVHAGTRSLLLSGALSALLGSAPAERFLPAANDFLNRQAWDEGFATAVHVCLDLSTGEFEIRTAGHPPAIQFLAGSGRWFVHDSVEGPVLGLVPEPDYRPMRGRIGPGDAVFLYTDGLVERRRRDISLGIDKLIGEGERLLRGGFVGSAPSLIEKLGDDDDDCALVVLQRS